MSFDTIGGDDMSASFTVHKSERSRLRRFPFLPRVGFTVDIGGRQFTLKTAPLLETLLNWRDLGFTVANFRKVTADELSEIGFPNRKAQTIAAIKNLRPKAVGGKSLGLKKNGTKAD